jgi:hypothetical protein
MSTARHGRVCLFLGSLVLTLGVAGADPLPSEGLARCAAVSSPSERLACYDTLAGRAPEKSASTASPKPAPQRPSTAPAAAPTGSAPAAAPAAAAVAAVTPKASSDDPSRFGLPPPPTVVPGPSQIEARVTRVNADSQGNVTLTLDNGQVWSVQQGNQWLQSGDNVTIRQAALGSFLLTTPSRHSYRVRRVQ